MSRLQTIALAATLLIAPVTLGAAQDVHQSAGDASAGTPSENAWDFTRPDSIPGFGTLPPGYDSSRLNPQASRK